MYLISPEQVLLITGILLCFGGWVDKGKGTFWRYHVTGPAGKPGPSYGARKSVMNISTYSSAKGYTPVRSNALKGQPNAQLIEINKCR